MPVKHIMDVTKSQSILMTKGNNYLNLFRWFYCFCIYVRSDVQSWKRVWMRINVVGSIEGQMQVLIHMA